MSEINAKKELVTSIRLKEKKVFLVRCLKKGVLLPSNFKKGIDRDLLITQQERKVTMYLEEIRDLIRVRERWRKKNEKEMRPNGTADVYHIQRSWKKFYIKKFDRLFVKQKRSIANANSRSGRIAKNKKDYHRYKKRKMRKKEEKTREDIKRANAVILNKSEIVLTDNHKLLLARGFNFVPTPKWNSRNENNEWLNLIRHIRSCEWASIFQDEGKTDFTNLPNKLKIPKYNRPNKEEVEENIQVYCEMARTKLRTTKQKVVDNYYRCNNLNTSLKLALNQLISYVTERKIVFCRSDKDGKIVVLNFHDYNEIMERELSKFQIMKQLTVDNIVGHFASIRKSIELKVIDLHKEKVVDDNVLKHVVGMKCEVKPAVGKKPEQRKYSRIPGPIAKHFVCNQPAYAYPLLKTHKLDNQLLDSVNIMEIPVRLLQSAGSITTSRVTAFIEMILNPISVKYCKYKVDEFCKDSKSYLETVHHWKCNLDSTESEELFLVAADVQSLYPSIPRKIVRDGLNHALEVCSDYSLSSRKNFTDLVMYCLENVVVQYGTKFYNQPQGIITGDNDSVSLANIALHYVLLPIADVLNKTIVFRRFIDDIIWFSRSKELTERIQLELLNTFKNNGLNLVFRRISTAKEGESLEFLDVDHHIRSSCRGGFYTKNFVKPTAVDRVFLNGSSHHPRSVFKSIIFSESIRLRRLCEHDDDYKQAVISLKQKCYTSGFNKNLVDDMINTTITWKERFSPPSSHKRVHGNVSVWATHFPKLMRLSKREKELNPNALLTYKRPATLGTHLTNYKELAHMEAPSVQGGSLRCRHCKLCGLYGGTNMVEETSIIRSESGMCFNINLILSCKNFGIYVATCKVCPAQYVGQTVNSFSERWSSHRSTWKSGVSERNDRAALRVHFVEKHPEKIDINLADAFVVAFVDSPRCPKDLDVLESTWVRRLDARVNINSTVLPRIL